MISCLITDDEPMARKGLEGYVKKIPFLSLEGSCEDAIQLNEMLRTKKPDLILLDIEMPYLSGIELLKTLADPPKVILTTAYENYALQGFDLDVLDYLLKPISFDRFLKSVNKAADYFSSRNLAPADHLFIKVDGRLEKVFFEEILFLQALENYVAVYTAHKKWITHASLKSMQAVLPADFVQTHKSWIINSRHITGIEGNILYCGTHQVPVSKYQREEVLKKILKGKTVR